MISQLVAKTTNLLTGETKEFAVLTVFTVDYEFHGSPLQAIGLVDEKSVTTLYSLDDYAVEIKSFSSLDLGDAMKARKYREEHKELNEYSSYY
jgi:hypothetical protein